MEHWSITEATTEGHFNHLGEVCHCPWGEVDPERYGSVIKEASRFDALRERKDLQDQKGQDWLNFLSDTGDRGDGESFHQSDKMMHWLTREWKKGRIEPDPATGRIDGELHPDKEEWKSLDPRDLKEWEQTLEEMSKRKQGVDLMQHKFHEIEPKIEDYQKWQGEQKRKKYGEVLHKFDNGWTVRRLQNDAEHRDEGNRMHHCVGQPQYGYSKATEAGKQIYASLRDEMNEPHATIEISPDHWKEKGSGQIHGGHSSIYPPGTPEEGWVPQIGPNSKVEQFFGPHDEEPEEEHHEMVNQWLDHHNAPRTKVGQAGADELDVMAPEDVETYNAIFGENDAFHEYADETDEEGRPAGEHTEYNFLPPDHQRIAEDYLNGQHRNQYRPEVEWNEPHTPEVANEFFETMRRNYHVPDFEHHLNQAYDPEDSDHAKAMDQWEQMKQPWYHPLTGEFVQGYSEEPWKQVQSPLFEPNPATQDINNGMGYAYDSENRRVPVQGPAPNPWVYNASTTKPLYYRWVFSPSKGVTIGSNRDDHPAFVSYHQGLGGEINDTDLSHGYAYPIGNGWRVTDYEHRPVDDPYIVNQVVRKLNQEDGSQKRSESSWQATEYDWDRIHYGLPREKVGNL